MLFITSMTHADTKANTEPNPISRLMAEILLQYFNTF